MGILIQHVQTQEMFEYLLMRAGISSASRLASAIYKDDGDGNLDLEKEVLVSCSEGKKCVDGYQPLSTVAELKKDYFELVKKLKDMDTSEAALTYWRPIASAVAKLKSGKCSDDGKSSPCSLPEIYQALDTLLAETNVSVDAEVDKTIVAKILATITSQAKEKPLPLLALAHVYIIRGDYDKAQRFLELLGKKEKLKNDENDKEENALEVPACMNCRPDIEAAYVHLHRKKGDLLDWWSRSDPQNKMHDANGLASLTSYSQVPNELKQSLDDGTFLAALGFAYYRLGKRDDAVAACQQALRVNSHNNSAQEILKLLSSRPRPTAPQERPEPIVDGPRRKPQKPAGVVVENKPKEIWE